jgi:hypothetical protein
MMSGVPLEICWVFNKLWNNKFYYKLHLVGISTESYYDARIYEYQILWNLIFEYFSKVCLQNSSFIKIGQEYGLLYIKNDIHLLSYLAQLFSEPEIFQTKVVEKIETGIVCSVTFFENHADYEIMWKSFVELYRTQMTIRRKRIASCIPNAGNIHSDYVTLIAFPLQQWLHEHFPLLRYISLSLALFMSTIDD